MTIPAQSKAAACAKFGCTLDQLTAQYAGNLAQLRNMHAKAVATGKKVNKYTAEQLAGYIEKYEELAEPTAYEVHKGWHVEVEASEFTEGKFDYTICYPSALMEHCDTGFCSMQAAYEHAVSYINRNLKPLA